MPMDEKPTTGTTTTPNPPMPPLPTADQMNAIASQMGVDMSALKGLAANRMMESEARIKKIEAEVMSRGLQLARLERNIAAWLKKQGHTYE